MHHSFEGLGTQWKIIVGDALSDTTYDDVFHSIELLVNDFRDKYSRFKPDTLVGTLNASGTLNTFPDELHEMLQFALSCADITGGHFNIAVGARLEDIGYDADYSLKPKADISKVPKLRDVLKLTGNSIKLRNGAKIDLGGFGKGWLIDAIAQHLTNRGVSQFMIDGGGDIRAQGGMFGKKPIYLESPFAANQSVGEVQVLDGAVASSSPKHRKWPIVGTDQELHHLLNPKSADTITNIAAVFTHGETALAADTASTCLFVSPPHLHQSIARHFQISYCVVESNGQYFRTPDYPGVLYSQA